MRHHRRTEYRQTYTLAAMLAVATGISLGVLLALVALAIYY